MLKAKLRDPVCRGFVLRLKTSVGTGVTEFLLTVVVLSTGKGGCAPLPG